MSREAKPRLSPYGLLSPAANVVELDEREYQTFDYEVYCGIGATGSLTCIATDPEDVPVLSESSNTHWLEYKTVTLNYRLNCSTMGTTPEILRERLDRQRKVQLEKFLGQELWNGAVAETAALADPENEVNRYLNDGNATVLTEAPVSPADALGLVEQAIAELGTGGVGVVHIPPLLLTRLEAKEDDDGVLRTKGGNIVITSTGYGTNGPEEGGSWIFGTGLVTVRLGDPVFYDDQAQRFINTSNNNIELLGEQAVAVTWNDCLQVAAQVNVNGLN